MTICERWLCLHTHRISYKDNFLFLHFLMDCVMGDVYCTAWEQYY